MNFDGYVKMSDFEIAKIPGLTHCVLTYVETTTMYLSPERIESGRYDYSSDIWEFGMTLAHCAVGENPWKRVLQNDPLSVFAMRACMTDGRIPSIPDDSPVDYPAEAKDFVRQCLRVNPHDRPTAQQLLQHPWLAGITETAAVSEVKKLVDFLGALQKDYSRERGVKAKADAYAALAMLDDILGN
eukprot:PhF_6_TR29270/c2_g2_i2/m.42881